MEVEFVGPYDRDRCHFCGKSDKTHPTESSKNVAGFSRAEDDKPTGPFFDACEACAKKSYPVPKQFQKEATIA